MPAVELQHVTKNFGSLRANDDISLRVEKGSIHALVGENGAGKSTLMRVLYGMHRADSGRIFLDGEEHAITSPSVAIALGIGMVHQHFMLVPPLTVAQNVILGSEPLTRLRLLDMRRARGKLLHLSETYKLSVDPDAKVRSVSVGMQQRVEILKILYRNAKVLILDEPTALLTPQEVEELFATLRTLSGQGKTVILITHKLKEVMSISDMVTVLRRGKNVGEMSTSATTLLDLSRLMIGRDIETPSVTRTPPTADEILRVDHLSVADARQLTAVRDVSFTVHAREILGIAAVEGNGQQELVQAVAGLRTPSSGTVHILRDGASTGIAHIPEDRLSTGVLPAFPVTENMILGRHREHRFSTPFILRKREIERFTAEKTLEYDIRNVTRNQTVGALSGGNQQKVVVARELSKSARLIIANHPTRGLDISALSFVHRALLEERERHKAILLVSSDLTELLTLSDRIAVMFKGEIVAMLPASGTTERDLGTYMTGVRRMAV